MSYVGIVGLPGKEPEALRRAAREVNAFVETRQELNEEVLHQWHWMASEGSRDYEYRNLFGPIEEVPPLMPAEHRGRFRDSRLQVQTHVYKNRVVERSREMEISIPAEWVGTPPAVRVDKEMKDYFIWLRSALKTTLDTIDLASEAYVRLVKIHPYMNVNDRVGWLIMNWIRLTHGHPPLYVTEDNLQDYLLIGDYVMTHELHEAIAYAQRAFRSAA